MKQPDAGLQRRTAVQSDIGELNTLFADAFTERYRRDGLIGVRVPKLSPPVWTYAIQAAQEGAMVWVDAHDRIVAFNIAHRSGPEGWMGPLAVRTDRQERGVGRQIVSFATEWLKEQGATTIGLETMPRTVENIGFYSRLGYIPGFLTVTMIGQTRVSTIPEGCVRLSAVSSSARAALIEGCREAVAACVPGYDFTRELELTAALGMGDTLIVDDGGVRGFAVWHTEPLIEGRAAEELRLLKLFADTPATFDTLMGGVEACAVASRLGGVGIRCQSELPNAYRALIRRGYRVRWTDLRMTLDGYGLPRLAPGVTLFSNWEI